MRKNLLFVIFILLSLAFGLSHFQTMLASQNSLPGPVYTASTSQLAIISPSATLLAAEFTPTVNPIPLTQTEKLATTMPDPTEAATPIMARLDPEDWQSWPVIPVVNPNVRAIYEKGQALGNNPDAFSIFGDCQSRPDEFLGKYETDLFAFNALPLELRATVENFRGSINRESPTSQDGTTPGALLWTQWHRGEYGCEPSETPVACELRQHRPSFVIIQIGTHFESRNTEYLRRVVNLLIADGVVPILATKADNREKDHRINRDMALLAVEFDLPLWNFWAAVEDLPNRGLYAHPDNPLLGDVYLTKDAKEIHRLTALEALNIVWRAATGQ
jgi:hypothetical protein